MKIGKYVASFLSADDIKKPTTVTIGEVREEKVGTDQKLVMYCDELGDQGIALNKTCLNQLNEIFGSDETDDWLGETVVVWNDPSVIFGNRKVGGIRFRKVKNATSSKSKSSSSDEEFADRDEA